MNLNITSDIGQLPPVNAASLFSHTLVAQLGANIGQSAIGQGALNGAFLWRQIHKVVILRKNERAKTDAKFVNLLAHIREGVAWNGETNRTSQQRGNGDNYALSDYETLLTRRLPLLTKDDKTASTKFKDAPIVVGEKVLRDALNYRIAQNFVTKTKQRLELYHADDQYHGNSLNGVLQKRILRAPSNMTNDAIGMLPLVLGMRVMVTDNVAMCGGVTNGCQGILQNIKYELNEYNERRAVCVYVHVPGANIHALGLPHDVIPIL